MSGFVGGQDNLCFEMKSIKTTKYQPKIKRQTTCEPAANSNKQSSRLLCFMVAVLGVRFILIAAATFVLALTIHSSPITTDPVTSQGNLKTQFCSLQ